MRSNKFVSFNRGRHGTPRILSSRYVRPRLTERIGIRVRPEIPLFWNLKPNASFPFTSLINHIIPPPLDRQSPIRDLQAKEDDQRSKRNPSRKGGGNDIVVFRPKSHVPFSNKLKTEPGDHDIRPVVAEVIGGAPIGRASGNHDGM